MYRVLFLFLLCSCGAATAKTEAKVNDYQESSYTFPLSHAADYPYTRGDTAFGAERDGGARLHAGCDLVTGVGTPVYAVGDGIVLDYYYFYSSTYAVEVQHADFIVRYGEISGLADGVNIGSRVKRGQMIARVGRLDSGNSMLHFEMYSGEGTGNLTTGDLPYKRRSDLMDPTQYLLDWPYPFNGSLVAGLIRNGTEND
jgi:murein DD-endopeptidase MepM/ murein hydrolase activator NlpD